jgi:hypothetical protein
MTHSTGAAATTTAAHLLHLADGFLVTQLLYVAAELRLADQLAAAPRRSADLAQATGAHPQVLHRVLRGLAAEGILAEQPDGGFALTDAGELLRDDVPGSLRGVLLVRGRTYYGAMVGLLAATRAGGTPFEIVHGTRFFDHLAADPAQSASFQASMAARSAREAADVVAAHDFTRYRSLVDVGGGLGVLAGAVQAAAPGLTAVIFDRPDVVEGARPPAVGGDFFVEVPPDADAYLLSRVIHDWDDDDALAILRSCRRAMRADSTLLLVDAVLPDRAADGPGAIRMDLHMLALLGGRERTAAEFGELIAAAGLRLRAVQLLDAGSGLHLIQAGVAEPGTRG